MNSHYISRFLTSPWEHGRRKLTYYDFNRRRFYTEPSKHLYAKEGLFSEELEEFFNKNFECIAASERASVSAGKEFTKFKLYKALTLLVLLQASRTSAYRTGSESLSRIMKFSSDELDQMVLAIEKKFSTVIMTTGHQYRLYVPDSGIFPMDVQTHNGIEWGFCLPFTPTCALGLMPVNYDLVALEKRMKDSSLMHYSVGSSASCKRLVIHPDVYKTTSTEKLRSAIMECRKMVDDQMQLVKQLNASISQFYQFASSLGLEIGKPH